MVFSKLHSTFFVLLATTLLSSCSWFEKGSKTLSQSSQLPPQITGTLPANPVPGDRLKIMGKNFSGIKGVRVGNKTVPYTIGSVAQDVGSFLRATDEGDNVSVTIPVDADADGAASTTLTVVVQNTESSSIMYWGAPPNPNAPAITSFAPAGGPTGTSVVITGLRFTTANSVSVNGSPATFTVNSATQITLTVPAAATSGLLTVNSPDGTATSATLFTVGPLPTITSLAPPSALAGASITLNGTNLSGATQVSFNGVAAASFSISSSIQVTAVVPAGASTGPVRVTTPSGSATSPGNFSLLVPPTLTGFSPAAGGVSGTLTLTGTNLTGTTSVTLNGTPASFTVASATSITVTVPAGASTGIIRVVTPGGTATSNSNFTVVPTPTITSFSPASGLTGTSVSITGTNFTGATAVSFNNVAVTTFNVVSATSITATVPAGASTGLLRVTTPGGTAASLTNFAVNDPPTITSFTPAFGPVGTVVTITGNNLNGATSVAFNATGAGYTVNSSTQITATVAANTATGALTVVTPNGTANGPTNFVVANVPYEIIFGTTLATVPAAICSGPFRVSLRDKNRNLPAVVVDTVLNFSANVAGVYFSDAGCNTALATATISAGDTTPDVDFYIKSTTLAFLQLNIWSGTLASANTTVIVQNFASLYSVLLSAASPMTRGNCYPLTATALNSNGASVSVPTLAQVVIKVYRGGSIPNQISDELYSDAACTTPTDYGWISSGNQTGTVYYKPLGSGPVFLAANTTWGASTAMINVSGGAAPLQLAGGNIFTCVLRAPATYSNPATNGSIWCWGAGAVANNVFYSINPIQVFPSGMRQVTAGRQFACGLSDANEVYCWGYNNAGQMGDNTTTDRLTPVKVQLQNDTTLSNIASISSGDIFTCATDYSRAVYCWGTYSYGQLGNPTVGNPWYQPYASRVVGPWGGYLTADRVVAGGDHVCAYRGASIYAEEVYCWGRNKEGQLGIGDNSVVSTSIPTKVHGLRSPVFSGGAGTNHSCFISGFGGASNSASCTGINANYELGNGTTANSYLPTTTTGYATRAVKVVGGDDFSCGLRAGVVTCWGKNANGKIGNSGTVGAIYTTPQTVTGLTSGVSELAAGRNHACAIQNDVVKCWGINANWQVDPSQVDRIAPVAVSLP